MNNVFKIYDVSDILSLIFEEYFKNTDIKLIKTTSNKLKTNNSILETDQYSVVSKKLELYEIEDILIGKDSCAINKVVDAFITKILHKVSDKKSSIYFLPAETLEYAGTVAKTIYAWLIEQQDGSFDLVAESNFLVLSEG